jgi:hypothetical protein
VVGAAGGDALAAGQPGADELTGVGAVDLGAGRAAGSAAGLACDRQDAAGFVDGVVAVDQFAGAAVDVVGAAAQQDWLQALSLVHCGEALGQITQLGVGRVLHGEQVSDELADQCVPAGLLGRGGLGLEKHSHCLADLAALGMSAGHVDEHPGLPFG